MDSVDPRLTRERATGLPPAPLATPSFGQLFREHSRYVIGLLGRLGVAPADVEDVSQEVFLAIHDQLPTFEGRSSIKTWLCSICRHKAGDYRRKAARRRTLWDSRPPDPEPWAEDPQQDLQRKQDASLVRDALSHLPEEQLEVFVLHQIEGLTMKEVAGIVGCPIDTAYTRNRVALQRVEAFCRRALLARGKR